MEDQADTTNITDKENKGNNHIQKAGTRESNATVNPSNPKTRVDDKLSSKFHKSITPAGGDRGSPKEAGNYEGAVAATLAKIQANVIVNPSNGGQFVATVDGVPVYSLGNDQVGDDNVKVLEDTVGSNQQTTDGKGSDPNGTIILGVSVQCTLT